MTLTIYDIAKEAGVSPSSVSRALNNKPGVNEKTRQRILSLLRQHDFVPNAIARGLVNKASKTVGIILFDLRISHHTDGVYYIQNELAKHGYCSLIINTGTKKDDKVHAIRELAERMVDGLIIMGAAFQCVEIKEAIEMYLRDTPVVMVNGTMDLPNLCGIINDEQSATSDCVNMLFNLGRRKIGLVYDNGNNPSVGAKKRGFEMAVEDCGIEAVFSEPAENTYQGGYDEAAKMISDHPDLDGLVCTSDLMAAGAIHALKNRSVRVPEDVSVIGMNNTQYAEACYPTITSLDTRRTQASKLAAKTLIKAIDSGIIEKDIVLDTEIVIREST
mgnify:FL=1